MSGDKDASWTQLEKRGDDSRRALLRLKRNISHDRVETTSCDYAGAGLPRPAAD